MKKPHPKGRVKIPLAHRMAGAKAPAENPIEEAGEQPDEESTEDMTNGVASVAEAEKGHAAGGFLRKVVRKKR